MKRKIKEERRVVMKKQKLSKAISVGVFVLAVVLIFSGAALAATIVTNSRLSGLAVFQSSADGVVTEVVVNASDDTTTTRTTPNRRTTVESSLVSISVTQTEADTGDPLLSVICEGQAPPLAFQIDPELGSATLDVSISCGDSLEVPSVAAVLTWTATADPALTRAQRQSISTIQPATASGTVIGALVNLNFTPDPAIVAAMESRTIRSVTVPK